MLRDNIPLIKAQVDSLINISKTQKDNNTFYYALMLRRLITTKTPFLLPDLDALVTQNEQFVQDSTTLYTKAVYYFELGNYYQSQKETKKSFIYLLQSKDLFEKIGHSNIPEIAFFLSAYASHYYIYGDYETAEKYYQYILSNNLGNQLVWIKPTFIAETYNNYGVTLTRLKLYSKALHLFDKCLEEAIKNNLPVYIGIASGNIGNILRLQKQYKAALPFLYKDVDINKNVADDNSAISCLYIANCLMELDSLPKAKTYINLAVSMYRSKPFTYYGSLYHQALSLYYNKTQQYRLEALHKDSLLLIQDSIKVNYLNLRLLAGEGAFASYDFSKKQELLLTKSINRNRIAYTIIGFMVCLGAILYYFIRNQNEKEKQLQQAKQQNIEQQLQQATDRISQFLQNIQEKNLLIEKIEAELLKNMNQNINEEDKTTFQVTALKNLTLTTNDGWNQFKQMFQAANPGFYEKLEKDYPNLFPAEIRLITLLQFNIENKELASILGISVESIRTSKYRLRKKYPTLIKDDKSV